MFPALRTILSGGGFKPLDLGGALYDLWDAERPETLTLAGAAVAGWSTVRNGYSAVQAVGASRPIYALNSFNGRPGVTFDGSDDYLNYAGVGNFPVGASPGEIWVLVDQTALDADTGNRRVLAYGGGAAATDRGTLRYNLDPPSRMVANIGTGAGNLAAANTVAAFGKLAVRVQIGATSTSVTVNGQTGNSAAGVPATGASLTRIGANTVGAASAFWKGVVSLIALTAPLTTAQAAQMTAYLKTRGGLA